MPTMKTWMDKNCIFTPYSMSIQEFNDRSCCDQFHTPINVRDLVMQRQPTPRLDTSDQSRRGHFICQSEALCLFAGNANAMTNLSDLPSKTNTDKKEDGKKAKGSRDTAKNKSMMLRSWENKKVQAIVSCYHCGKPHCIFACEAGDYYSFWLQL